MRNSKAIATPEQLAKVKALIDQYAADGNRMVDEDATLNDIKNIRNSLLMKF